MSIQTALDGICRYFGGAYDEPTRTYRASPLTQYGVGIVRRAWAKDDNLADYFPDVANDTAPPWRRESYERIAASVENPVANSKPHQ